MAGADKDDDVSPHNFFEPRPRREFGQDVWPNLREAVIAALTYEHPARGFSDEQAVRGWVWSAFADHFDDRLYIHRPTSARRILDKIQDNGVVAVVGERGSGKSTLLRRIARHPSEIDHPAFKNLLDHQRDDHDALITDKATATLGICYIDLLAVGVAFDPTHAVETDLYSLISRRLKDELFPKTVDAERFRAWRSFRLDHSRAYSRFREVHREEVHEAGADRDPILFSRSPVGKDVARACDEVFNSDAFALESIQDLCTFVQTNLSHQILLVLDNIDHLDPGPQEAAIRSLAQIAQAARGGLACCTAIRRGNWRGLASRLEPIQLPAAVYLSPYDQRTSDATPHLGPVPDAPPAFPDPEDLPAATMVGDFLSRRLGLLVELVQEAQGRPLVVSGRDGASTAESTALALALINSVSVIANSLLDTSVRRNQDRLVELSQWHNGSLRHVATTISRLALDALSDGNPDSPYAGSDVDAALAVPRPIDGLGEWSDAQGLLVDTHMYRKFFLIGRASPDPHASATGQSWPSELPFIGLRDNFDSQQDVIFVKYRAIQYLEAHDNSCTVGELIDTFAKVRVPEAVLRVKLQQLARERSEADTGLISVNGRNRDLGRLLNKDDSIVYLQEAGSFFHRRYGKLPDYLFWAASRNSEAWPCFRRAIEFVEPHTDVPSTRHFDIPFRFLANCEFRLIVAAEYLTRHVLPLARHEMPDAERRNNPDYDAAQARLRRVTQNFGWEIFVQRAYNTSLTFGRELEKIGRCSPQGYAHAVRVMNPVRAYFSRIESARRRT